MLIFRRKGEVSQERGWWWRSWGGFYSSPLCASNCNNEPAQCTPHFNSHSMSVVCCMCGPCICVSVHKTPFSVHPDPLDQKKSMTLCQACGFNWLNVLQPQSWSLLVIFFPFFPSLSPFFSSYWTIWSGIRSLVFLLPTKTQSLTPIHSSLLFWVWELTSSSLSTANPSPSVPKSHYFYAGISEGCQGFLLVHLLS